MGENQKTNRKKRSGFHELSVVTNRTFDASGTRMTWTQKTWKTVACSVIVLSCLQSFPGVRDRSAPGPSVSSPLEHPSPTAWVCDICVRPGPARENTVSDTVFNPLYVLRLCRTVRADVSLIAHGIEREKREKRSFVRTNDRR